MVKIAVPTSIQGRPQEYEEAHVHNVYDRIADHFSSTRYKPWPIVAQFLSDIPTGWIGLDSGTGNGKYLPIPTERPGSIFTIGLDRSHNLLELAKCAGGSPTRDVLRGDVLGDYWRLGAFDYALSIATVHHLASPKRRKQAIERLIQSVSSTHGRILIYVWATKQDELSRTSFPKKACWSNEDETRISPAGQDVFVPWVTQTSTDGSVTVEPETSKSMYMVLNRYYHMFSEGELSRMAEEAAKELDLKIGSPDEFSERGVKGLHISEEGWERSNYYLLLTRWEK
ncbi:hypothetical protein CONPUDRAFT_87550 [Coniophora puteana RWD-64-598 SS2]|uniref:Methyltransferase type 11 domain-containing protein n=1 Tax=Coniophora puteana (strain RWD-64-598) TaxID=741705 RepID=A0A5M3N179_CONPW|nr:uncharacterized protein CONPUDRAFT_87550 [Coniophora puteana RWD-64-598 SS2]EIW85056.1 hypothetical protein CONPUDRAFT_87550 [Coniophora puteana RWD-64-598 SS2]